MKLAFSVLDVLLGWTRK